MGAGIAEVCLAAGHDVRAYDGFDDARERGLDVQTAARERIGIADDRLVGGVVGVAEVDRLLALLGDRELLEVEVKVLHTRRNGLIEGGANPDNVLLGKPKLGSNRVGNGGLKALNLETGKLEWNADVKADRRGQAAPATSIPGVVFTGGWDGILRAVDTNGKVIWTFNAMQDFTTINGVVANGGSFGSSGGAVIANGMLFITAGYTGIMQGAQGNVVLAFAAE